MIDAKPVNVTKVASAPACRSAPSGWRRTRSAGGNAHTIKAKVLEFIYMGDVFRTRLKVAGNENFIMKTRNAPDQVRHKPGDMIEIGWMPTDCRALDFG